MNASQSVILAAAVSGILVGVSGCGASKAASPDAESTPTASRTAPGEKHACKGQNDCAHQGGCKTDAHTCKGQNDCRSQGGCHG